MTNNSLGITTYLFGNIGENYTVPSAPSAPVGFAYIGLDSSGAPATGTFQDTMGVVTYRYGQLFDTNFHLNYTTNDNTPSTQTIAETQLLKTVTSPSRIGYTFNGWNTVADGSGKIWDFDTDVMPSASLDLHTQWSINQYQLSFNLNGGDSSTHVTRNVDFDSIVSNSQYHKSKDIHSKGRMT